MEYKVGDKIEYEVHYLKYNKEVVENKTGTIVECKLIDTHGYFLKGIRKHYKVNGHKDWIIGDLK